MIELPQVKGILKKSPREKRVETLKSIAELDEEIKKEEEALKWI